MPDSDSIKQRKKLSLCCIAWIVVFSGLFIFYVYKLVQFDHRVRLFNDKIQIGMTEVEVLVYLGPPSTFSQDIDETFTEKFAAEGKKYDEIRYKGAFFLRDDLFFYFDSETKRLVYKQRAYSSPAWSLKWK
jgi:hypothetical protein